MRGSTARQLSMLSAISPDELVPATHPIRRIWPMVELALESLGAHLRCYVCGRGSALDPPEHLLTGCRQMAV
jgi:hypothetical protein